MKETQFRLCNWKNFLSEPAYHGFWNIYLCNPAVKHNRRRVAWKSVVRLKPQKNEQTVAPNIDVKQWNFWVQTLVSPCRWCSWWHFNANDNQTFHAHFSEMPTRAIWIVGILLNIPSLPWYLYCLQDVVERQLGFDYRDVRGYPNKCLGYTCSSFVKSWNGVPSPIMQTFSLSCSGTDVNNPMNVWLASNWLNCALWSFHLDHYDGGSSKSAMLVADLCLLPLFVFKT